MGEAQRRAMAGEQTPNLKQHKKRASKAWTRHDEWQEVLNEVYDYVAPYRLSSRQEKKSPGGRSIRIFDNTACVAHMRSTGRLQQELLPPGEPFFTLDPGPAVEALGMNADDAAAELEQITAQIQPVFLNGEWDQANHELLGDTLISTGVMMVLEGDDDTPVRFVTACSDEVAFDLGPYGRIAGVFFKRKWSVRTALETWPKGKFPEQWKQQEDQEQEYEIAQDVVYDAGAKRWKLYVYLCGDDDAELIWQEDSHECPCIISRYWKLPGMAEGYGPVLMTLPTTKTLNKAMEITLKAAAIGMSGIYTRIDDGVFNPDTARIEPGAFWSVARNGGPMGPSIQKLEGPGDLGMSQIVLQDLRMQVQTGMLDQQLPPDHQTPKSAVEIIERIKNMSLDHAGAFGRLVHDIIVPVVRRVIEILHKKGVLKTRLKIDQLLVKLRVLSPLAGAFNAEKAQTYLNWLQIAQAVGGPEFVHGITPLDEGLAEIGRDLGVPAHLIFSKDERQGIQTAVANLVQFQLAQQAKQQQQPPAPPNGAPMQEAA